MIFNRWRRIFSYCRPPGSSGVLLLLALFACQISVAAQGSVATQGSPMTPVLGDPFDVSNEFSKSENVYFVGDRVTAFDSATGVGALEWKRYARRTFFSFNKMDRTLTPDRGNEFPPEY